jgi:hypothetical protein
MRAVKEWTIGEETKFTGLVEKIDGEFVASGDWIQARAVCRTSPLDPKGGFSTEQEAWAYLEQTAPLSPL